MSEKKLTGPLLLTLTAFIWGTAFVAQSVGMDHLGPCAFNAARSLIGGTALLPVIFLFSRRRAGEGKPEEEKGSFWARNRTLAVGGVICGLLLGSASVLQQTGLQSVSPGKAGFLTALYIVMVPVLGIFFGRRPGTKVWIAVPIALAGAWLLSVTGDLSVESGDLLLIGCALIFSFHIMAVDRFSPRVDGVKLSCVQFFTAGLFSLVLALALEDTDWRGLLSAWGPLLYTGVLSSGVAYTLQILGQKRTDPTVATLIMSLESVFAALAGWVVLGEPLSPRELMGCALVLGAVVLAQLPSGLPHRRERTAVR